MGLQLRGARIVGVLDLDDAVLRCPLRLDQCVITDTVLLNRAPGATTTGGRLAVK